MQARAGCRSGFIFPARHRPEDRKYAQRLTHLPSQRSFEGGWMLPSLEQEQGWRSISSGRSIKAGIIEHAGT